MPRLGDDIDDYCSRCQRTTDHSIVVMAAEEVEKTRCRTCNYEHKYRKNRAGRKEMSAQEAFQKVLASVGGQLQDSPKPKTKKKRG
jgi:NMD protein affecting ribosome stability and mRNA decay